jgi:hypothetical protein
MINPDDAGAVPQAVATANGNEASEAVNADEVVELFELRAGWTEIVRSPDGKIIREQHRVLEATRRRGADSVLRWSFIIGAVIVVTLSTAYVRPDALDGIVRMTLKLLVRPG